MNSTLVFLFLMMVCSSTASLFTNKTIMFLTSTATNETIAKVKELGRYCNFPGNLKSRPQLYEPGWWCVVGVTCIPMSNICNGIYDCKDYHKSDERTACNLYPDTGCDSWFGQKFVKCGQTCVPEVFQNLNKCDIPENNMEDDTQTDKIIENNKGYEIQNDKGDLDEVHFLNLASSEFNIWFIISMGLIFVILILVIGILAYYLKRKFGKKADPEEYKINIELIENDNMDTVKKIKDNIDAQEF